MRAIAIALGACTLASLLSSSLVDFSMTPRSELTPHRGAFSIWGLIYTLLAASTVVLGSLRDGVDPSPHILVCVSLAITCIWSVTVTRSRRVALVALAASALAAWVSLVSVRDNLLFSVTYGLLAGWLSVATTISIETNDTRALVIASAATGSVCIGISTPWPCASLLWGLVCQRNMDAAVVGSIVITILSISGSVLRRVV